MAKQVIFTTSPTEGGLVITFVGYSPTFDDMNHIRSVLSRLPLISGVNRFEDDKVIVYSPQWQYSRLVEMVKKHLVLRARIWVKVNGERRKENEQIIYEVRISPCSPEDEPELLAMADKIVSDINAVRYAQASLLSAEGGLELKVTLPPRRSLKWRQVLCGLPNAPLHVDGEIVL